MKAKPKTAAKKVAPVVKPEAPPNDAVREVRTALGMTQEALAIELKCSYASVRNFETKRRIPKNRAVLDNLKVLAKRAGVEI